MAAAPNLPTPDFTFDSTRPGACIAGVRPYRNGSYRLEAETAAGKFIVHNYGHGGAGVTLSWGCAAKVRDIVRQHLATSQDKAAAVLGAGVMGMTAATLLLDLGLKVTIYSERKPAETTSSRAGGQWAVSVVEFQGKQQEFAGIVKAAYTTFKDSIGKGFGVSEQPNYTAMRSHNLDVVLQLAPGLIPEPVHLARLPFEGHTQPGWEYQTLLIEPPIFLARLESDLNARGAAFVWNRFASKAEVLALTENIIVNCTGLGAMTLWSDAKMQPIKGQLALLPPQPNLQYLYGQNGYMFPRTDHLVIGGTFEIGVNNEMPSPSTCQDLVDHIASLFGKRLVKPLPEIHIHHPDHAPIVNPAMPGAQIASRSDLSPMGRGKRRRMR
jgi:glycine/D-amino acid oxidase-like deaminating enzyme